MPIVWDFTENFMSHAKDSSAYCLQTRKELPMFDLNIRREIRKEAICFIQKAGLPGESSPEERAIKLIQLLQKNNPRSISDSKNLIETYLDYLDRLLGAGDKETQAANKRKVLAAIGNRTLFKTALQYNYDSKQVTVGQDLSKLAVRILSTYMRTANLLDVSEIALAYQKIYTAILNSVVPRFN